MAVGQRTVQRMTLLSPHVYRVRRGQYYYRYC